MASPIGELAAMHAKAVTGVARGRPFPWAHHHQTSSRTRAQHALVSLALIAPLVLGVIGCSRDPLPDGPDRSVPELLAKLAAAEPVGLDSGAVAEAFALNTRATDVQREALEAQLVGNVVQWSIKVYEVTRDGQSYRILSQPIAVADPQATPLLRVLAVVMPRSERDRSSIEALSTGDEVTVKGLVRSVMLRTVLTVHPAVLADGSSGT